MKELELKLWLQSPLLHFDKCSDALSALMLPCQPSSAVTVNSDSCCLNSLALGVSGLYLMAILLGLLFFFNIYLMLLKTSGVQTMSTNQLSKRRRGWFIVFADFSGINIATTVNFKMSKQSQPSHKILEILSIGSCHLVKAGYSCILLFHLAPGLLLSK